MIVFLINQLFGYRIQTSSGNYLRISNGLLTTAKEFNEGSDFIKFPSHNFVQIKDHNNIALETKSETQLKASSSNDNSSQLFNIHFSEEKHNTIKITKIIRSLTYCFTHTGETITLNACIKNSPEQFFRLVEENPENQTERDLAEEKARKELLKQEEHLKRERIIAEELENIKEAKRQALEEMKEQKRALKEAKREKTRERMSSEASKARNIFQRLWDQMKAFRTRNNEPKGPEFGYSTEPLSATTQEYTQPKIERKITDAPSQLPEVKKEEPITLPDVNYAEKLFENDHEQNNMEINESELHRILRQKKIRT